MGPSPACGRLSRKRSSPDRLGSTPVRGAARGSLRGPNDRPHPRARAPRTRSPGTTRAARVGPATRPRRDRERHGPAPGRPVGRPPPQRGPPSRRRHRPPATQASARGSLPPPPDRDRGSHDAEASPPPAPGAERPVPRAGAPAPNAGQRPPEAAPSSARPSVPTDQRGPGRAGEGDRDRSPADEPVRTSSLPTDPDPEDHRGPGAEGRPRSRAEGRPGPRSRRWAGSAGRG